MVRAVYFDLDGTLFDDRQYVRAGLLNAAAFLAERTDEAVYRDDVASDLLDAYFQRGIRENTFDVVLDEHDLSRTLVPSLVDAYHNNDGELVPYPGTVETLNRLEEAYELGLITGGRNGTDKLDRLGISGYFETVLVTSDRDHSKRDPDPFKKALSDLGVDAEDALYVGDRPGLDFPQSSRLGMTTVRVRTGRYADADAQEEARPDFTISTISTLPELIANID